MAVAPTGGAVVEGVAVVKKRSCNKVFFFFSVIIEVLKIFLSMHALSKRQRILIEIPFIVL